MIRSLKELSTIYYGKSPNSIRVEDSQFPIYGTGGQVGCASAPLFNGPLVVVARKGTLSKPIFSESACWVIDTAYALITKPDVDAKWLYYNLDHYNLESLNEATGVPSISRDYLYRVEVEFVSKPEQCQIQKILSTIDNLIKHTHSLIAKYNAIKQGMMQDLFTMGIGEGGELRQPYSKSPYLYKESKVGVIPASWEVVTVGSVFDLQLGKMLSQVSKKDKNPFPYLANRNVQWEYVDLEDLETMDFNESERAKFALCPGDLLVCEGGEVGRTAIWCGEMRNCYYQKAIHRLRPKSQLVNAGYMLRFMRHAANMGWFTEFTSQSSIAHLTMEKLALLPMLLPTQNEQIEINKRFDAIDANIKSESEYSKKLLKTKSGLMQDLLTGKVRVNVDESVESERDVGVHQS